MLLPPSASPNLRVGVEMVGSIVEWVTSLLLCLVFALLLRMSSRRRVVATWMIAWMAVVVATSGSAWDTAYIVFRPTTIIPLWTAFLSPFYWPARFVFLAAIVMGSLGVAGYRPPVWMQYAMLIGAALVGFAGPAIASSSATQNLLLVANAVLIFASVQVVLLRARNARHPGLIFLATALTLFGILSTVYLSRTLSLYPLPQLSGTIQALSRTSGYGDAASFAILASAVIVTIVQEAFLDSRLEHETRVAAVTGSEARLNAVIQAAREAIVTVDADGRIDMLNDAARLLLSTTQPSAIGERLADHFAYPGAWLAVQAKGSAAERLTLHSAELRRGDGAGVPVEFTAGPIRTDGANGMVVVLRDVSAHVAELSRRETFERQLAEADKMLAIGRVVSGVAHELNNPLSVVLGQSELLVDTAPAGEVQNGLKLIQEQAQRARHIVRDLLAFVRRRDDLPGQVVPLAPVVCRAIGSQQAKAAAHHVTIEDRIAEDLPCLAIDQSSIEQVVVNMIANGIDAAGAGGTVRITSDARHDQVDIIVDDSGPGVPDELVSRVFEPFFTTKAPGQGTGLGLSVSREIAEQHRGSLCLANRPAHDVGARFVLTLPLNIDAAEDVPVLASHPFPRPIAGPAEAMLIDDEPSVRATLRKLFTRNGWTVHEASSGAEALEWLYAVDPAAAPSAILCDLKMPGMSGHEVYQRCRATHPDLAARFIFVTGDVVGAPADGLVDATGQPVVEKPFTVSEIARTVGDILQGAGSGA
jgi:two-component system NtrC family sensor kinase